MRLLSLKSSFCYFCAFRRRRKHISASQHFCAIIHGCHHLQPTVFPLLKSTNNEQCGNFQRSKTIWKFLFLFPIATSIMFFAPPSVRFLIGLIPMDKCTLESVEMLTSGNSADSSLDLWSRNDVQTCTSWKAPIIWEGMFNPSHYDQIHRNEGSSVALTVFAVGRYLNAYLEAFLNSSEQHFMSSLPVTYYVFTDSPELVPNIKLAPDRHLKVIEVERHTRWQDISMMRMKAISDVIKSDIRHHATHVFCFDVDQVFTGRFGPEALGDSVALLHAHYYHLPRMLFTYDRNPKSKAFMKTGDFYYHAAVFGGSWRSVKALTEACYRSIMADKENGVEALWHDESHLNRYFWLHKPSRVLSPEFCWDTSIGYRSDIQVYRLLWAPKDYYNLRT